MHDWTLLSLVVDWMKGDAEILLKNQNSHEVLLRAEGLLDLKVPKREDWGSSVSVNQTEGPIILDDGNSYFAIEMQSGDKIELEAHLFILPQEAAV